MSAPPSPSSARAGTSLPSSTDTTPKAGVSVRSVRTTGAWAKKSGGGTPDKPESARVGGCGQHDGVGAAVACCFFRRVWSECCE